MIKNTASIIKRNMNIMLNSKLSSLILILGPILLILITGAALKEDSIQNIKAGLFFHENNQFSNYFIQKLEQRSISVMKETSLEKCKQNVLDGVTQVCIELTKSENSLSNSLVQSDIILYVDFSKQRTVWDIIGRIQGIVESESANMRSAKITEAKESMKKINEKTKSNEKKIDEITNNINYLKTSLSTLKKENREINSQIDTSLSSLNAIESSLSSLQGISQNTLGPLKEKIDSVRANLKMAEEGLKASGEIEQEIADSEDRLSNIEKNINSAKKTLNDISSQVEQVRDADLERIANPIKLTYQSVSQQESGQIEGELKFIDYLFPSFLAFFMLFISLILSTTLTIRERSSNAYIRNIVSPTSGLSFIIGNFLTCFILLSIQVLAILLISSFFLNINIQNNILPLAYSSILLITLFTLFGMAIGYMFNSQENAIVATISFSLLLLIFLPIITPLEILPALLSKIVGFSPLTILENKLRLISIFNMPLTFTANEIISIASALLLTFILIIIFHKKSKEKEI
jgi:ABC-type multidrug transport system permease subunit/archaellum component FlaC